MSSSVFLLFLVVTLANTKALGAEIIENFTAVTLTGISASGTLGFDPGAFAPAPVAPSGSVYLASYQGGPGSVSLVFEEAGLSTSFNASASSIVICSGCNLAWDLTADSGQSSLNMVLDSLLPVTYAPGQSVLDPGNFLDSSGALEAVLSDPTGTTNFDILTLSDATDAPEPGPFWLIAAIALLTFFFGRQNTRTGCGKDRPHHN
jgi:hypothetical protein